MARALGHLWMTFCWCLLTKAVICRLLRHFSTGRWAAPAAAGLPEHMPERLLLASLPNRTVVFIHLWDVIALWRETKGHSVFCLNHLQRTGCLFLTRKLVFTEKKGIAELC